ncbi:YodL domain-containing protein [Faecalibacterium sp. An121]|uniref:YodL domain-containing protein n=1 Tax=Faecalibacterium sp. An121 TaxID=1965550 RepID=UPI000B38A03C|nr:YodL domain-containing protein [Faecalibacterium sp. An121]OUQ34858.1 hypothetical protein B5E66_11955 [Faecalibacterium sp. An121]
MMQDVLERFFAAESNVYLILQLKDEQETADVRFESFARLEQMGKTPNPDHYEAVYFANTPAYFYGMSNVEALEELYLTFNLRRPEGFRGHSLSVSDVVVLNREGQTGAFYVDRIGFKELPGFLEQMKEAARPQKSVTAQVKQTKETTPRVKTKKHKERDAR